ncbi:complex I subunit 5 family protein [Mycobacterium sp. SMC-4]|uniref:complex I subunit 5 family protein n=1 Tax=Mycobacterium sp. SMC-4 TaxID=2857059 RepID=UPI0021B32351|nr:proton-conducting transporter membrane subunit [Mycobacterium sp. SMC-4]UXA18598.1 formate hydrogenlyase [Mycobacterium sp. SMC-4]
MTTGLSAPQTALWIAAISAPLAVMIALATTGWWNTRVGVHRRRTLVRWAAVSTVPAGVLAALGPGAGVLDVPWLVLGTSLQVDALARPLVLMTVVLYGAALVTVAFSNNARAHILSGFLLTSFLGNIGVFLAADTVSFYTAFAVMSLSAYGCVVHTTSAEARRAGRVYLVLTMISELAVLAALVMVVGAGGGLIADAPAAVAQSEHRAAIIALLFVGFGIKAGTVPLHVWLPLAHPAAPIAASAVLSGAMVKAGLFGWLRFLPLGEVALPGWGVTLVVLAVLGAFLALPIGVLHRDPKVALAYSTISQMGFLTVLVGIALAQPELAEPAILAAVVYAVHHGVAKGGLFLGVAVWRRNYTAPARYLVLAVLALLALAVAGAPLGSGSVAKYAAKEAISPVTFAGVELTSLLPWVGTVSTLLLARAGWVLLTGRRGPAHRPDPALASWVLLALAGTGATWVLAESWAPLIRVPGLDTVTVWDASWPILIGVLIAGAAMMLSVRDMLPPRLAHPDGTLVPAGDLIVPEEAVLARIARAARRAGARSYLEQARWIDAGRVWHRLDAVTARWESALDRWGVSGVAILCVGAMLVVALCVGVLW